MTHPAANRDFTSVTAPGSTRIDGHRIHSAGRASWAVEALIPLMVQQSNRWPMDRLPPACCRVERLEGGEARVEGSVSDHDQALATSATSTSCSPTRPERSLGARYPSSGPLPTPTVDAVCWVFWGQKRGRGPLRRARAAMHLIMPSGRRGATHTNLSDFTPARCRAVCLRPPSRVGARQRSLETADRGGQGGSRNCPRPLCRGQ